jgi:hypothetical protein
MIIAIILISCGKKCRPSLTSVSFWTKNTRNDPFEICEKSKQSNLIFKKSRSDERITHLLNNLF